MHISLHSSCRNDELSMLPNEPLLCNLILIYVGISYQSGLQLVVPSYFMALDGWMASKIHKLWWQPIQKLVSSGFLWQCRFNSTWNTRRYSLKHSTNAFKCIFFDRDYFFILETEQKVASQIESFARKPRRSTNTKTLIRKNFPNLWERREKRSLVFSHDDDVTKKVHESTLFIIHKHTFAKLNI